MEWTWLKDWWRLKKFKSRQHRHIKKNLDDNGTASDDDENEGASTSRRGIILDNPYNVDNDNQQSDQEDQEYGDDDDICYCDECLNVC